MSDVITQGIAVGDKLRVHFHSPGSMKSFFEGVVTRIDVPTADGRVFVVRVEYEVILGREHRIRPDFHDYVRYECPNDFSGRIETLSTFEAVEREHAPPLVPVQPSLEAEQEIDGQHQGELEVHSNPAIVQAPETAINFESTQVDVDPQPARKPRGLIAALFGQNT